MKAFVDENVCISCGMCEGICGDVFSLDTGVAVAIEGDIAADLEDAVNATNKLIEDIGAIEGTKDEDATAKLDEIDDIKYKLVCCF